MMIIDHPRDLEELKKLYDSRPMPNQYDWDWLINNPNLFCFYDYPPTALRATSPARGAEMVLRGFITVQREGGLLTLSGTSIRKNMPDNIQAIIKICEAFNEDMYAYTRLKHAGFVLKKAGFKHIKDNKYVRYKTPHPDPLPQGAREKGKENG